MPSPELKKWKQQVARLSLELQEKDYILKKYQNHIQKTTQAVKEITEKISKELEVAHRIHHLLLPTTLPVIAGFKFSFKFRPAPPPGQSRDFYEITPYPGRLKSFGVSMFSSPSYSLSSLLLSLRIKNINSAQEGLSPAQFLSSLRGELKNHHPPQNPENMDLFYALINQKTHTVTYLLSGQTGVFVWHNEKQQMKKLLKSAFDTKNQWGLKAQTFHLNKQDRLIVCSPGLLKNPLPYPPNRLKQILKKESDADIHKLRNHIMYDTKNFFKKPQRDQSVIIIEPKKKTLTLAKTHQD